MEYLLVIGNWPIVTTTTGYISVRITCCNIHTTNISYTKYKYLFTHPHEQESVHESITNLNSVLSQNFLPSDALPKSSTRGTVVLKVLFLLSGRLNLQISVRDILTGKTSFNS